MRPKAAVWFEILMIGSLALGLIQSWMVRDRAIAMAEAAGRDPMIFVYAIQAVVAAFVITMTLCVSRGGSKLALGVLVIMFLLGMPTLVYILTHGLLAGPGGLAVAHNAMQLAAFCLLITPPGRAWMRGRT